MTITATLIFISIPEYVQILLEEQFPHNLNLTL